VRATPNIEVKAHDVVRLCLVTRAWYFASAKDLATSSDAVLRARGCPDVEVPTQPDEAAHAQETVSILNPADEPLAGTFVIESFGNTCVRS
jgi:hypothetical protein